MRGDTKTDALYGPMRERFSRGKGQANGYRYNGYFRAEQELLSEYLSSDAGVTLDACCGSGIMLSPLMGTERFVFGIDFNQEACNAAQQNGFVILRGDVFRMPLADDSVDEIVNCQFFNQQTNDGVHSFVQESLRVLKPGGRVILVWRNGRAAIHRLAHCILSAADRVRGLPVFPQFTHDISDVRSEIEKCGGEIEYSGVQFAPFRWRTDRVESVSALLIGASNVLVARKNAREDP